MLVDVIAGLVKLKSDKILSMNEINLMNYLRKDIITECFEEYSLHEILNTERVDL